MTASRLVAAWLAAVAMAVIFVIAIVSMFGEPATSPPPRTDIVAIGTSLMAHAVPISGEGGDSLLGDGRSHFRVAQTRRQESEILSFVDQAIDRGASLIFVEANPFLVGVSSATGYRYCDGPSNAVRLFIGQQPAKVRNAMQRLRGKPVDTFFYDHEPADLQSPQRIDPRLLRDVDGLVLLSPCDEPRIKAMFAAAKARQVRIVFVLFPRSPRFDETLGPGSRAIALQHAHAVAARLGVELFAPAGAWSNAEFADQSHMNILGRRHFLRELRHWWIAAR